MDLHLKNKTAIVTGGTAGIGLAIVQALTAEGVTVTLKATASAATASTIITAAPTLARPFM